MTCEMQNARGVKKKKMVTFGEVAVGGATEAASWQNHCHSERESHKLCPEKSAAALERKWPRLGWWRMHHVSPGCERSAQAKQSGLFISYFLFFIFAWSNGRRLHCSWQLAAFENLSRCKKKKSSPFVLLFTLSSARVCVCLCVCVAHIAVTKISLHSLDAAACLPRGACCAQRVNQPLWMSEDVRLSGLKWHLWLCGVSAREPTQYNCWKIKKKKRDVCNQACVRAAACVFVCAGVLVRYKWWGKNLCKTYPCFPTVQSQRPRGQ